MHYIDKCWVKNPEQRKKYALGKMKIGNLQRDFWAPPQQKLQRIKIPELNSWQCKILIVHGPWKNCWFVDSTANVYVCNNFSLMTNYYKRPTNVRGSSSEEISLRRKKIRFCLSQKNDSKSVFLNISDVYFFLHGLCNLVSFGCLNNYNIYHDNKNKTLYYVKTRKILIYAEKTAICWHL